MTGRRACRRQRAARADVEGRHGVAAHGAADQPDDDHRRADVRRTGSMPSASEAARRALARFPPFRQRAVQSASGAWWETDRGSRYRLARARRRAAGQGRTRPTLETFVSELASTPLDHARPLWQFHVVDNYDRGGGVLIARIHHCYADGLALVQVLLSLTDTAARPESARRARQDLAQARSRRRARTSARAGRSAGLQKLSPPARRRWEKIAGMLADPARRGRVRARRQRDHARARDRDHAVRRSDHRVQGTARRRPSASRGPSHCRSTKSRRSARRSAARSTTCCSRARRARCAVICATSATMSTA